MCMHYGKFAIIEVDSNLLLRFYNQNVTFVKGCQGEWKGAAEVFNV